MKTTNVAKNKKIASIVGISVASILVIIAFCGRYINGGFRNFANFFVGTFGMAFYGIMAAIIVACSFTLAGKTIKIPVKYVIHFVLMFVAVVLFVHVLSTTYLLGDDGLRYTSFSEYIKYVYNYYADGFGVPTFGGVLFGMLAYAFVGIMTIYGASILFLALLGWTVYVVGDFFYANFTGKLRLRETSETDISPTQRTEDVTAPLDEAEQKRLQAQRILFEQETTVYPEQIASVETPQRGFDPIQTADQSQIDDDEANRQHAIDVLFKQQDPANQAPQQSRSARDFFDERKVEQADSDADDAQNDEFDVPGYYNPHKPAEQPAEPVEEAPTSVGWKVATPAETNVTAQPQDDAKAVDIVDISSPVEPVEPAKIEEPSQDDTMVVPFDDEPQEPTEPQEQPQPVEQPEPEQKDEMVVVHTETVVEMENGKHMIQEGFDVVPRSDLEKEQQVHQFVPYEKPPYELLDDVTIREDLDGDDRQRAAQAIVDKYAVFKIQIETANIIVGPSVTRYMFNVLSQKTRMDEFKQYANDIKACIEAQEDVIIYAPVHGTNQIGIDVANKIKAPVVLRALLESPTFQNAKGKLVFAIGQEITGKVVVADLSDMPHLLIAGTTGSGKSVALNCLIVSMMYKYGPEYVRFLMVDPKFVELSRYNGIPHMLTNETITTMDDALAGMDYLVTEMDARYQLFRAKGVGNIVEYNSRIHSKKEQKLPYLVFIVDELADLMSTNKKAFEHKLGRLAQKSRAAGIHIVLATQRPDVSVITGNIKANLPCRMALKVSSQFDSSTILGYGGAEKLLGKGDMLFVNSGSSTAERIQGAYITNDEIRGLVDFLKAKNEVYYDPKVSDEIFVTRKRAEQEALEQEANNDPSNKDSQIDPLCKKALRFWLEKQGGRASIASIQRTLSVGFNRAGRIMATLQELKYVETPSPSDTSGKQLRVLVTLEDLDSIFPDLQD